MAAADKARFYLEQYVPELQEYERKQLFSRDEITAITKKRSDFEHVLNARCSSPGDYARYAIYEMNLDSLRKKRCNRLGVKSTAFSGQRTVFFILDRATRKFPGDMGLWMQLIRFCQQEKANKKLAKAFTAMLRLKPREWGVWVLAAKHYAEEQGDMSTARSYLQRGLGFCKDEKRMYLEYAKMEMVYLAKLAARRKILGLDDKTKENPLQEGGEDDDIIFLPEVTAEDINPDAGDGVEGVNADALNKLASAPAFTGAIVIAIFDAAMHQFANASNAAEDFFDLVASFHNVPASGTILQRILGSLQSTAPDSPGPITCEARLQLLGVNPLSADFPLALGKALGVLKRGLTLAESEKAQLATKAVILLLPNLRDRDEMDEGLRRVLEASLRRYLALGLAKPTTTSGNRVDPSLDMTEMARKELTAIDLKLLEGYTKAMESG